MVATGTKLSSTTQMLYSFSSAPHARHTASTENGNAVQAQSVIDSGDGAIYICFSHKPPLVSLQAGQTAVDQALFL